MALESLFKVLSNDTHIDIFLGLGLDIVEVIVQLYYYFDWEPKTAQR